MPADPHEVRMAAGQASAAMLEALDDEAVALCEPVAETLDALTDHLRARGLPSMSIAQVLVGIVVAEAFRDDEPGTSTA